MTKKILIGISVLIVGFLIYIGIKPSEYQISRSITINAKPDAIFPYLSSQKNLNSWSPWLKKDPAAELTYSGSENGAGSKFYWRGNSEIGTGYSTITESRTNEFVRLKLNFLKPMQNEAESDLTLKNEGDQTVLTWSMYGHNNFVCKIMDTLMNMDKMVGGTFEEGLSDLKKKIETK